jgi:hypothetical protein
MEVSGKEELQKDPEFTRLRNEILRAASMAIKQLRNNAEVLVVSLDGEVRALDPEHLPYWLM